MDPRVLGILPEFAGNQKQESQFVQSIMHFDPQSLGQLSNLRMISQPQSVTPVQMPQRYAVDTSSQLPLELLLSGLRGHLQQAQIQRQFVMPPEQQVIPQQIVPQPAVQVDAKPEIPAPPPALISPEIVRPSSIA